VLPDGPGLARVTRPSDAPAAERLTGSTFSAVLLGLAGVVLPVSGIRVADTMVISVLEGRREITNGPHPRRYRSEGHGGHRSRCWARPAVAVGDGDGAYV
jgi:hypothetical protein